jgi:hypothetical protein
MTKVDKIPRKAIRALVNYLEHDERKDLDDDGKVIADTKEEAKSHIYNHVRRISNWLEKR